MGGGGGHAQIWFLQGWHPPHVPTTLGRSHHLTPPRLWGPRYGRSAPICHRQVSFYQLSTPGAGVGGSHTTPSLGPPPPQVIALNFLRAIVSAAQPFGRATRRRVRQHGGRMFHAKHGALVQLSLSWTLRPPPPSWSALLLVCICLFFNLVTHTPSWGMQGLQLVEPCS